MEESKVLIPNQTQCGGSGRLRAPVAVVTDQVVTTNMVEPRRRSLITCSDLLNHVHLNEVTRHANYSLDENLSFHAKR